MGCRGGRVGRGARPASRVKDLNPDGRRSGGGARRGGGGTVFSESGSLLVGSQRCGVAVSQLFTASYISRQSTPPRISFYNNYCSSVFVILCENGLNSVAFLDVVCVCSGYLHYIFFRKDDKGKKFIRAFNIILG